MSHRRRILAVEDNAADVRLLREALRELEDVDLEVAGDGSEALAALRGEPPSPQGSLPDLVLLDLNLPGTSGFEVLDAIRSDPSTRGVPVVVLTTSTAPADVHRAYARGANAYLVKSVDYEAFRSAVATIDRFWLRVACLPRPTPAGGSS